jgi:hypothetical protein
MSEIFDRHMVKDAVNAYGGRSLEISGASVLDAAEAQLVSAFHTKGFSFPTNEGMRKITKPPEMHKLESDPNISTIARNIRTTMSGLRDTKPGGLYAGTNAFHHGHLAYLSRSEGVLAYDMNPLIPYGFAFIVGLVGGSERSSDFRNQVCEIALNPDKIGDYFKDTPMENSGLLSSNLSDQQRADYIRPLFQGIMTTMDEFNPAIHGPSRFVPPVFCWDEQSYNYFRQLILQEKVAGMVKNVVSQGFIGNLANAVSGFGVGHVNTLYFSSIFDPRFAGPSARKKYVSDLRKKDMADGVQVVESFLNSGWIVYDIKGE